MATRSFNLAADCQQLDDLARRLGDVALIVVDPITAYLGRTDSHKNAEVRAVLAPLAAMASEIGAAIVCVLPRPRDRDLVRGVGRRAGDHDR